MVSLLLTSLVLILIPIVNLLILVLMLLLTYVLLLMMTFLFILLLLLMLLMLLLFIAVVVEKIFVCGASISAAFSTTFVSQFDVRTEMIATAPGSTTWKDDTYSNG